MNITDFAVFYVLLTILYGNSSISCCNLFTNLIVQSIKMSHAYFSFKYFSKSIMLVLEYHLDQKLLPLYNTVFSFL